MDVVGCSDVYNYRFRVIHSRKSISKLILAFMTSFAIFWSACNHRVLLRELKIFKLNLLTMNDKEFL